MSTGKKAGTREPTGQSRTLSGDAAWKLEDAKARFSEVVRRARSEGPQKVSVRGRDAVVVIAAEDLERLVASPERAPLVDFLESLFVEGLDLTREADFGRELVL